MDLKYKREGFAQTRDALAWVGAYAADLKFGLTVEDVFAGLEHGFQSVRHQLTDPQRIAQWELARHKLREAHALYKASRNREASLTLQESEELFGGLRRIGGKTVSRQQLGDTEHGANNLDE